MHNNSNICIINLRIPRQTKQNKKKIVFFFMTSARYYSSSPLVEHDLVLEKKKKIPPKISCIFRQKYLDFHPQTLILQSKPKKMHKKRIIARTKQALIFEISSNELQKITKIDGFCSKQYSLQVSNLNWA